jgi:monoamine oxidase
MNDIIIIGGGISGLYCFYELEKKYKNLKISLFEKNNYFGGRFLTKTQKIFDKSFKTEVGAGRLNKNHKLFLKLIKELKLEKDLIKTKGNNDICPSIDYNLNKKFKNKSSFDYINKVIKKAEKEDKKYLIQLSFKQYAQKVLKKDELKFLYDFSGYYGQLYKGNCYDVVKLFKYGIKNDIDYFVLKNGFSSVIAGLLKKIKSKNLYIKQELLKINKYQNTFLLNINGNVYQTKHLILALPKPALLNINYLNIYKKDLNSIICKELCRIYSIFPKVWFKDLNKITTNNKLRFIIPIDKESGLIMISYSDSKYANYWKKFLNKPNEELVNEINTQLSKIFPYKIEKPIYTSIYYWNCGVAYWKPKIDSEKISEKILKLNNDDNLYIIGENYSKNQSWAEGGLETVNELLNKYKF